MFCLSGCGCGLAAQVRGRQMYMPTIKALIDRCIIIRVYIFNVNDDLIIESY